MVDCLLTILVNQICHLFSTHQTPDSIITRVRNPLIILSLYQMNMSMTGIYIGSHSNWGVWWTIQSMTWSIWCWQDAITLHSDYGSEVGRFSWKGRSEYSLVHLGAFLFYIWTHGCKRTRYLILKTELNSFPHNSFQNKESFRLFMQCKLSCFYKNQFNY